MLKDIKTPADIKELDLDGQKKLAEDIRSEIISAVENNGGHLSSNLGIVETTIALFFAFDLPTDKVVFDVGHQCYAYKLLSGRAEQFSTIRQTGGLSGFPSPEESEYDSFATGHAGSSIAQGLGLCYARDKLGESYAVICIVGDGALSNGLNLEALTASNIKPKNFIVILNDNGMSISKNTNGFYKYISSKTISRGYVKSKKGFKKVFKNSFVTKFFRGIKESVKRTFNRFNYFESCGFKYFGVVDGNDQRSLNGTLEKVRSYAKDEAVLLHISTVKGKGSVKAEDEADVYHGVSKKQAQKQKSFSSAMGEVLGELIKKDDKITAITAAMKDGTGLKEVERLYPDNFLDVGIAEEYAVTLASGMAKGGLKPILFIYSTFLQRAYDQIVEDVCLQKLPVVFCIDRAGLVGEDGKTHQGVYDLSFLSHIPNMTVLSVSDERELSGAISYALSLKAPVAIRYPKNTVSVSSAPYANGEWIKFPAEKKAKRGRKITILAVGGRMTELALSVQRELKQIDVYAVRSIKPLDQVVDGLEDYVITLEENTLIGGFGWAVKDRLSKSQTRVYSLGVPDTFVAHGDTDSQLFDCGLTEDKIKSIIDSII